MDIFEYAMQMEKDGESYYRELAGKTSNRSLQAILNLLADAEVKHYKVLKQLKDDDLNAAMEDDVVFANSKNIFTEMKTSGDVEGISSDEAALYRKAYEIETKSYDFYTEKAGEVSDDSAAILRKIADEEKRHMVLMESLAEMVDRPQSWLDDAEWNHWDEY
jgi:rubrerythrin